MAGATAGLAVDEVDLGSLDGDGLDGCNGEEGVHCRGGGSGGSGAASGGCEREG